MKSGILAAAFLLMSAGLASADYVIIVANVGLGGNRELNAVAGGAGMAGGGMAGMVGMAGMIGGSSGIGPGGPGAGMAGMQGMRGGSGPMGPGGPGAGMAGMQGMRGGSGPMGPGGPGGAGMGGMQGMQGNRGGMMMGMMGGMQGMQGMQGNRGGMMMGMGGMQGMQGNRGGMMMGMGGMMGMMGMRGGMMGMGGLMNLMAVGSTDADDVPDYVIAVVEVKPAQGSLTKILDKRAYAKVELPKRLGKSCFLLKKPSFGELFVITESQGKPVPTVASRFQEMFTKITNEKEKPSVSEIVETAQFALEHGLVDKFPSVMAKLIQTDKTHPAAVAYEKVKLELDRKAGDDASATPLRRDLLRGYKSTETPHYLIIHNAANDTAVEIKTHVEHLENTFNGFYYWFALKGVALSVPKNRQVVVMTHKEEDFEQLRKILTPGPMVVDGFFGRRENLAVMYAQRQDDTYRALSTYWENYKGKDFHLADLLAGRGALSGAPKSIQLAGLQGMVLTYEAQMIALMLKALEQEAELATVSHNVSRQLLFASGLLPRNVAAPEWLLFGMGSFFETPLQSPWPTIGAPSPYYLPRWRELKAKEPNKGGLEKKPVDTLRKVVTDSYFRSVPPDGKTDSPEHILHMAALRKARTVAWSLTYFLAQQNRDGLRRYFTELSKMPRDIELDDKVLFDCFARAFGCVDANGKLNESELKKIASDWYGYWQSVHFESESTMREIRKKIAEKIKETQDQVKQLEASGNQAAPNGVPGLNPGAVPGVLNPGGNQPNRAPNQGGGVQPRGPTPPNNPQQGGRGGPAQPRAPIIPSKPQQGGKGGPPQRK